MCEYRRLNRCWLLLLILFNIFWRMVYWNSRIYPPKRTITLSFGRCLIKASRNALIEKMTFHKTWQHNNQWLWIKVDWVYTSQVR